MISTLRFFVSVLSVLAMAGLLMPVWAAGGQSGLEDARELARSGDTSAAIKRINGMLAESVSESERIQGRYLKGVLLLSDGDSERAAGVFERMIADYPTLPEPYNNLAAIRASDGHYEQARQLLLTLLEIQPDYVVAIENLGDLYARMAADAYQRAETLRPRQPELNAKVQMLEQLFRPSS